MHLSLLQCLNYNALSKIVNTVTVNVVNMNTVQVTLLAGLYFLVLWDHGFHCGALKLLEGH